MHWIVLVWSPDTGRSEVLEVAGERPNPGTDVLCTCGAPNHRRHPGHTARSGRVFGVLDRTTLPLKIWASIERYRTEPRYREVHAGKPCLGPDSDVWILIVAADGNQRYAEHRGDRPQRGDRVNTGVVVDVLARSILPVELWVACQQLRDKRINHN